MRTRFGENHFNEPDVTAFLSRFGFTVILFLLRSLVSMNFNVVYIYTAEVHMLVLMYFVIEFRLKI